VNVSYEPYVAEPKVKGSSVVLVTILTTPPNASVPAKAEAPPLITSNLSTKLTGIVERSTPPPRGLFSLTPSRRMTT